MRRAARRVNGGGEGGEGGGGGGAARGGGDAPPLPWTRYKSPNTDVLGMVAEAASGRSLAALLRENVEGAALAGALHCACDATLFPALSGGVFVSARDLARHGLVLARRGRGARGERVGSAELLDQAIARGRGTALNARGARYSNMLMTDGRRVGHGGYAGQYLLVDPPSGTVVVFLSVLESADGEDTPDDTYFTEVVRMCTEIAELYDDEKETTGTREAG